MNQGNPVRIIIKRNSDWETKKPESISITSEEEILELRHWDIEACTLCSSGLIKRPSMYPGRPGNRPLETSTIAQHLKPDPDIKYQLSLGILNNFIINYRWTSLDS